MTAAVRRCTPLVFVFWLLSGCMNPPAASAQVTSAHDPAGVAVELVRLFDTGELSSTNASALLGEGSSAKREGAYWNIRRKDGQQTIVMRATEGGHATDDVELRLDLNAGLTLADLEKKFGLWQIVAESKTSSVSFRFKGTAQTATVIFARLLAPKADPNAPVTSLQLRRDSTP